MSEDWDRPDSWERVSLDDLPGPDLEEYPIPEPDVLTEEPVTDGGAAVPEQDTQMYCSGCDDFVPENYDRYDESWKCPECGKTPLYENKEEYIEATHAVARWQRERGWGPWYEESETDRATLDPQQALPLALLILTLYGACLGTIVALGGGLP